MYSNKSEMDESARGKIIDILSARLADSIDLMMHSKQAHWNIKGPQFIALHKLFDKCFEHCVEYVDLLGERIVQLGGRADGAIKIASQKTALPEYPLEIVDGAEHVEALSSSMSQFGAAVKQAIQACGELGDFNSADIFTEISRALEKDLWFVDAHIGGDALAAENYKGAMEGVELASGMAKYAAEDSGRGFIRGMNVEAMGESVESLEGKIEKPMKLQKKADNVKGKKPSKTLNKIASVSKLGRKQGKAGGRGANEGRR